MSNRARWIFLMLFAAGVLHVLYFLPELPQKMAVHFGLTGEPDNWFSKNGYLAFQLILLTFITAVLAGTAEFMTKVPAEMINIPNKEYWLSEEREHETRRTFRNVIYWIGSSTLLLLFIVNHKVIQFNTSESADSISGFWFLLVAYLTVIGLLLYRQLKVFYTTPG